MSQLIQSQIQTAAVMACCGIAAGLVINVFRLFISRFILKNVKKGTKNRKITALSALAQVSCCIIIAVMIGEFLFFCRNGKLSFLGAAAFLADVYKRQGVLSHTARKSILRMMFSGDLHT